MMVQMVKTAKKVQTELTVLTVQLVLLDHKVKPEFKG